MLSYFKKDMAQDIRISAEKLLAYILLNLNVGESTGSLESVIASSRTSGIAFSNLVSLHFLVMILAEP